MLNVGLSRSEESHLSRTCLQINPEADQASLKSFPGNPGCFEIAEYIVDKWSTISMKNVNYSVPDHLVGEVVGRDEGSIALQFAYH